MQSTYKSLNEILNTLLKMKIKELDELIEKMEGKSQEPAWSKALLYLGNAKAALATISGFVDIDAETVADIEVMEPETITEEAPKSTTNEEMEEMASKIVELQKMKKK